MKEKIDDEKEKNDEEKWQKKIKNLFRRLLKNLVH